MMKIWNYMRCSKFQVVKLRFIQGWDNMMSMVVEVGEVESRDCLGEPHPRGKRLRDFDAARGKAPVQTQIFTGTWTNKGKSAKEAIG
jgi:hypothetical protein